jgi:gamma-glutamylcyclotransferase (GGCT)/AIG2-like uncharacterized protein YtfP
MPLSPAETETLFAYGTLLDDAVQLAVFGRRIPGMLDALPGYVKTTVELEDEIYPNVARADDGRVGGQVFRLSARELAHADAYETEAYARIQVTLESGKVAWLYVAPPHAASQTL